VQTGRKMKESERKVVNKAADAEVYFSNMTLKKR